MKDLIFILKPIVLAVNITAIPHMFALIIKNAFGAKQIFAGILGYSIQWGVKRGIYINEAGQGTVPQSSAAEVSHLAIQGLVQAFAVYFDTLFVCSATAFMILSTGIYNVINPAGGFIVANISKIPIGPVYTQMAVSTVIGKFGGPFVAIALFFYAITTLMAYYYIVETNLTYLVKNSKYSKIFINILRVGILASTFYGSIKTAEIAWALGDIAVGSMAWLNVIAILILDNIGINVLKDYEKQLKMGRNEKAFIFEPKKSRIKNADAWYRINERKVKRNEKEKRKNELS